MSKQEDILTGDFGLTDEVAPVAKSADAETLVTRLEDRFSDSMTLLKRIPVTLTLEVSSVEIMLADLLNIDDDTVIELDESEGAIERKLSYTGEVKARPARITESEFLWQHNQDRKSTRLNSSH